MQLPTVIYVAVGISNDQRIDTELRSSFYGRMELLQAGFQRLNPGTTFQLSFYPEDELPEVMRRRNRQGLGPDLLLVNGDTARRLLEQGLSDPYPASSEQLNLYDEDMLQRVRTPTGEVVGLPVLIQTQLSCFNRNRIAQAPATLEALLATSTQGATVGLPSDLRNLFWTVGSTGAIDAFTLAAERRQLQAADRQALARWFSWLQNASNQQRVVFYATQELAKAQLASGTLDWIPCRSAELSTLRRSMGHRLGVAALPNGNTDGAIASPVNRVRLWSLGRSSSPHGRARALAFTRYSLNPLTQRSLTLGSLSVLPANRFVRVPVQSSSVLEAMVTALAQGNQTNRLVAEVHSNDERLSGIDTTVNGVVFGELAPAGAASQLAAILQKPPTTPAP